MADLCNNEQRLCSLEKDSEHNTNTHREFYKKFEDLNVALAVQNANYANILAVLSEIKTDVSGLKEKPAKRWETVIVALITGAVAIFFSIIKG